MKIDWESSDGLLKANGKQFYLKGINWYGFEVSHIPQT
jgi:beta-galactosidase/beta-glucuronidase